MAGYTALPGYKDPEIGKKLKSLGGKALDATVRGANVAMNPSQAVVDMIDLPAAGRFLSESADASKGLGKSMMSPASATGTSAASTVPAANTAASALPGPAVANAATRPISTGPDTNTLKAMQDNIPGNINTPATSAVPPGIDAETWQGMNNNAMGNVNTALPATPEYNPTWIGQRANLMDQGGGDVFRQEDLPSVLPGADAAADKAFAERKARDSEYDQVMSGIQRSQQIKDAGDAVLRAYNQPNPQNLKAAMIGQEVLRNAGLAEADFQKLLSGQKLSDATIANLNAKTAEATRATEVLPKTAEEDTANKERIAKAAHPRTDFGTVAASLAASFNGDPLMGIPFDNALKVAGEHFGIAIPDEGQAVKTLDRTTAAAILKEAGGDKNKAREIAKQKGYTLG